MLIKKYTSEWIANFADLKCVLDSGLSGIECHIEHIGSTAVPGLDSKPIIDIDLIYDDHELKFETIKSRLVAIGYCYNGDQGIEKREVFKRGGKCIHQILDTITHHLYVCPKNSKALERHILTRNVLRKNDWARLEYQKMKYELAEKANQNKKRYAELKEFRANVFFDKIIEEDNRCH